MGFFDFLKQHGALTEENLTRPKLQEWVQKYLAVYPPEQQEKDMLKEMASEPWYDMEQVLAELHAEENHGA
jgi:hypothetical protein